MELLLKKIKMTISCQMVSPITLMSGKNMYLQIIRKVVLIPTTT